MNDKTITNTQKSSESKAEAFVPVVYSSHPVQNLQFDKWKFENGLLILKTQEEADQFEKDKKGFGGRYAGRIKKISSLEASIIQQTGMSAEAVRGALDSTQVMPTDIEMQNLKTQGGKAENSIEAIQAKQG